MDPLASLLRSSPTELARLSRAAVAGFIATLESGLVSAPGDPSAAACRAAVDYLRTLAGTAPPNSPHPTATTEATPATPSTQSIPASWQSLGNAWAETPEWTAWVGGAAFPDNADLAKRLWLTTLRLPPDTAREWQKHWLKIAGTVGESTPGTAISGPFDALLCPALPGETPAVRMSLTAPLDSRLGESPAGEVTIHLARVASALLWFIDTDPALRHNLRAISRFGVAPVPGSHRPRYQKALVDRLDAVRRAEDDPVTLVLAWADFDETAHSLTFEPHPHPASVFSQIVGGSRAVLGTVRDRAAVSGVAVHVQVPAGRYVDCRGLTDPEADIEVATGAVPGEITHCIRAFVRLDGTAYPGRVAYRPR